MFYKRCFCFQVPLEGFKALQGISGPQRLQIHKAYGSPERLPSAHTWLDIITKSFFFQLNVVVIFIGSVAVLTN